VHLVGFYCKIILFIFRSVSKNGVRLATVDKLKAVVKRGRGYAVVLIIFSHQYKVKSDFRII